MRADAHTLLAAYAAGSLGDVDRGDVEAHLAECAGCRDDLRGDREVLASLALLVAEAPPLRMRDEVLRRVTTTAQLPPLVADGLEERAVSGTGVPARQGRPSRTLFALAATVLAATAISSTVWGLSSSSQLSEAEQQQAAVRQVLGADDAQTVRAGVTLPDGSTGDDVAVLASDGVDSAVLLPVGLPAAPDGMTWQAWTIHDDVPRPNVVFDAAQSTVALDGPVADADAVAVTLEPAGGSSAPTSDPVAVVPLA